MSVSEKMRKAGAEVLWSLADTEGDGPAFERVSEAIYLAMQAADDERNRLREALVDIRNRILCPVGPSPTLDEVEAIASAALTADDGDERHSSPAE